MDIIGIDVSHYQGIMDWQVAKNAGIRFAILKSSEGTTWRDPQFNRNALECERLDIPWGAYHYWYPQYSAKGQADNFIDSLMGHNPMKMGVYVDMEQRFTITPTQTKQWAAQNAHDLLESLQDVFTKVGVYTSSGYFYSYVDNPSWAIDYILWVANYGVTAPKIPQPWKVSRIWQYTSSVAGSKYGAKSITIDVDKFMGTEEEFQSFIKEGISEPIPPIEPVEEAPYLFSAVCIKPEGVDTRNEFGVDIKQDLHFKDIVNVYEVKKDMQRIDPVKQRWVTTSTNYMLKLLPPESKPIFSDEEKAILKNMYNAHKEIQVG